MKGTQPAIHPISVNVPDACRALGIARSKFYELVSDGHLSAFKVGKRRLVRWAELERFIADAERIAAAKAGAQ